MEEQILLLEEIKSALWILIYLIGLSVFFNAIRATASSYKVIKSEIDDAFYNKAYSMFEEEKYDKVIEFCLNHLEKKPKEGNAFWFLGKTYFAKKQYEKALDNFNKTIEICPTWEKEWVAPYLEKIEAIAKTANKT